MEEELCLHLHKNDIEDHDFWLSQLKDFGIESKEALVNFEGDKKFLRKITAKARNEAEKKAITKLLRIDKLEQKEIEGAQQTLKEAEATAYDRQKLDQERIQKQTSVTQNVPQTFSSNNKHDENQKTHQQLSRKPKARDALCESELLEKCSGGQALKGVFLKKEHLEEKDFLLENPGTVLVSIETCSNTKTEQFSSKDKENKYKNEVHNYCVSSAISASIGYGGIAVNAGVSAGTYLSTVKYSRVQTASITLKNEDLKLSKDAMSKLKQIQDILKIHGASSAKLQEACEQFFNDYGSHANKGPLCFGGIFWWTCFSEGFHENEAEAVEKLQSKAISVSAGFSVTGIGASASLNIEQIKGSYQGKCSDHTLASTKLWIDAIGGPPVVTDLSQWKSALVAYSSTWRLISRGELKPIWDIIKLNHDKELGEIKEVLRSTWENMTGIKAWCDFPTALSHNFESFTKFLKTTLDDAHLESLSTGVLEGRAANQKLTQEVSTAINYLRSSCRKTYDEVLITVLVHPFQSTCSSDTIILKPISLNDLKTIHKLFTEQRTKFLKFQEMHALNLQAFLFRLATDLCQKEQIQELFQKMRDMIDHLHPPLRQELVTELQDYSHSSILMTLKKNLDILMTATPNSESKHPNVGDNVNSLKRAVDTPPLPDSTHAAPVSLAEGDALTLLDKLGLTKYYPKRLQQMDALCIKLEPLKLSLGLESPTDPKQLPFLALHKLMSYDSRCRSHLMPVLSEDDDCQSLDSSDSESESEVESETAPDRIHPVDCLLSLFLCSNDFLRQDLFSRLAKCQLAVPFILPDPFTKELTIQLWGLRSIVKEWECTKPNGEVQTKAHAIISYEMPIISFIRVGKHHEHVSKSKILNDVITTSEQSYAHFFHRNCRGGSNKLVLGKGLIDICWYLPGKIAKAFQDAITFLNLHGDAREHPEQMRFLSQISSMCFVLLTEEDLQLDADTTECLKQFGSQVGGLTVISSMKKIPKFLKKKFLINPKGKNDSAIEDAIKNRIKKKLESDSSLTFPSIEDCCGTELRSILIDEHSDSYKQGFHLATKVMQTIHSSNQTQSITVKDVLLPLQGESLWKAWAVNNREAMRLKKRGNEPVLYYADHIEKIKAHIRMEQLKHVDSLTPKMEAFLIALLTLEENKTIRRYFLQCLKLQLDNLSRESVSYMQYRYQSAKKELQVMSTANYSSDQEKTLKKKLEDLQNDIINSSIGLEHLFRELGQMYEAVASKPDLTIENLYCLPRAAAEHLIDGYPLELMDGDAAHVPLQWVTAVLEETTQMLGDPKVFVLSVLGLQSTGTSTMLNTVFGLQFKFRCTRGAFMQLLPLDEELRARTSCSYVLVVDTEGLRAPELDQLDTQIHDNELATFVIGLANMTFINIKGEVAGDIDDILQISVHAFLQMQQIKFSPSCQFIHQNVSESSEEGRDKFTEKLNHFTIIAAKQEKCEGKFTCFNDVVKFNDQSDVHCFPGLWMGSPPMAPINQGYSHSSQMLKLHFIDVLCKRSSHFLSDETGGLRLSAFNMKVADMWSALLKKDFFSASKIPKN